MNTNASLGEIIHREMRNRSIPSFAALAHRTGVHLSTVARWASDTAIPSRSSLAALSVALGVPVTELERSCGLSPVADHDQRTTHPLAQELDALLSETSYLSDHERYLVELMVDTLLDKYRRLKSARRREMHKYPG